MNFMIVVILAWNTLILYDFRDSGMEFKEFHDLLNSHFQLNDFNLTAPPTAFNTVLALVFDGAFPLLFFFIMYFLTVNFN